MRVSSSSMLHRDVGRQVDRQVLLAVGSRNELDSTPAAVLGNTVGRASARKLRRRLQAADGHLLLCGLAAQPNNRSSKFEACDFYFSTFLNSPTVHKFSDFCTSLINIIVLFFQIKNN